MTGPLLCEPLHTHTAGFAGTHTYALKYRLIVIPSLTPVYYLPRPPTRHVTLVRAIYYLRSSPCDSGATTSQLFTLRFNVIYPLVSVLVS